MVFVFPMLSSMRALAVPAARCGTESEGGAGLAISSGLTALVAGLGGIVGLVLPSVQEEGFSMHR
jgi:hypothetical protein